MSKGQAGLLVGSFAIGQGLAAVPVALIAGRIGVRRITVWGLSILGVATLIFAVAGALSVLVAARLAQGLGAGLCFAAGFGWLAGATPKQHRARAIGTLSGGAAAGHALGPLAGAAALDWGRVTVLVVLSGTALGLAGFAARLPRPVGARPPSPASLLRAHWSRRMLGALWLIALPGSLIGMVFTIAPLQLAEKNLGPNAIALTFLIAAAVGVVVRPVAGFWADRTGLVRGLAQLLALASPFAGACAFVEFGAALAVLVLVLVAILGATLGPAMAFASSCYESAQVPLVVAFAFMAAVVGCSLFVGAVAAGALAESSGNSLPYALAAALMLASVGGVRHSRMEARRRSNASAPGSFDSRVNADPHQ